MKPDHFKKKLRNEEQSSDLRKVPKKMKQGLKGSARMSAKQEIATESLIHNDELSDSEYQWLEDVLELEHKPGQVLKTILSDTCCMYEDYEPEATK